MALCCPGELLKKDFSPLTKSTSRAYVVVGVGNLGQLQSLLLLHTFELFVNTRTQRPDIQFRFYKLFFLFWFSSSQT